MRPIPLAEFRDDCRELGTDRFRERHGDAFLVHYGSSGQWTEAGRLGVTNNLDGAEAAASGMRVDMIVFPIPAADRSRFPDFISVGRAENNDIVIRDGSLSKFHAYIRRLSDGTYGLSDAGSRNGTSINDEGVPVKDEAAPIVLESGMRVSFGSIQCSFLYADEFRSLVNMTAAMPA